jgi:hypothetical protein
MVILGMSFSSVPTGGPAGFMHQGRRPHRRPDTATQIFRETLEDLIQLAAGLNPNSSATR